MGNAQSELQHIANALSGLSADEKKFLEAVLAGKTVVVRDILMANPNVIYARTKEWQNAWHIAALSGTIEMLEVLHRHGSKATRKPLPGEPTPVNHKNKKGTTPLMVAVMAGREQAMQYLLAVGAEARNKDFYGNTCVHYAAVQGHVKILELLLATSDAEMEEREQHGPAAVQQLHHLGAVARILGAGAASQLGVDGLAEQLAKGRYVAFRNEAGLQPLHFAVWGGDQETVKVLLRYGASPTERSGSDSTAEVTCNGGSTPLHVAGLRNNVGMVQFLLEWHVQAVAAANPSNPPPDPRTIKDNYSFTPYQLAKNLLRDEVLPLLDPRGKLPSIDTIRVSASVLRSSSIRRSPNYTHPSTSARSSDDGSSHKYKSVSMTADSATGANGQWDPFGTGAYAAVPALPPPPTKKVPGSGVSPHKVLGLLPPVSPPPARRGAAGTAAAGTSPSATGGRGGDASPAMAKPSPPPAASAVSTAAAATSAAGTETSPAAGETLPGTGTAVSVAPPATGTSVSSTPSPVAVGNGSSGSTHTAGKDTDGACASAAASGPGAAPLPPPPREFLCPITNQVMGDPVIASDGRSYERTAIEMWLDIGNTEFPGGEAKVTSTILTPNDALKQQIQDWQQSTAQQ